MDKAKLISSLQQIKNLAEECLGGFQDAAKPQRIAKTPSIPLHDPKPARIDFDKPLRPFIKQYAKGMSGAEKFILLLSRLVKGDLEQEVALVDIVNQWNKMKSESLLSMDFNRCYSSLAKDYDWVESKKKGFYNLRPDWKEIFESSNG
ncbi:MAG: hypothetical protein NT006_03705 [Candidatus Aminicenantes bacterium]|nr:hypothetical protein [Candidatus Aminicenantes bacterium]